MKAAVKQYGTYYFYAVADDTVTLVAKPGTTEAQTVVAVNFGPKPTATLSGSAFFVSATTTATASCDNADFTDLYYTKDGGERIAISGGTFTVSENGTYTVYAVEPNTGSEVASEPQTFKYINHDRLGSPDSPYTPEWTVAK